MLRLPAFPTPGEHVGKTVRKSKPGAPVTTPAPMQTQRQYAGSAAHTSSASCGATAKPTNLAAFNPYISGSLNFHPKRAEAT